MPETGNWTRQVHGACYSRVQPTPVAQPQLVACAREVVQLLGLPAEACQTDAFAQVFAGNRLLPGMQPYAACYGGHQFGNWAGQLGDGRAINLGEIVNCRGERWTLQLKGAGPTPYSRRADGLAVLRSSVREFLCSEAMHHLGVPTTRALSLVLTGEQVIRDMFYDGHPQAEPGAVVCRVAPSFTRFGNFEIFAARQEDGRAAAAGRLHHPHRLPASRRAVPGRLPRLVRGGLPAHRGDDRALDARRLRARGDEYRQHVDPRPDHRLRPLRLAGELRPGLDPQHHRRRRPPLPLSATSRRSPGGTSPSWRTPSIRSSARSNRCSRRSISTAQDYAHGWQAMMAQKLGLTAFDPATDPALVAALEAMLQLAETDMTLFYRALAEVAGDAATDDDTLLAPLLAAYYRPEQLTVDIRARIAAWLRHYLQRLQRDGALAGRTQAADARRQSQIRPAQLPGATGHRPSGGRRPFAWSNACSRCCAAPTTNSRRPRRSSHKNAPNGPATGPAVRCSPAVRKWIRQNIGEWLGEWSQTVVPTIRTKTAGAAPHSPPHFLLIPPKRK